MGFNLRKTISKLSDQNLLNLANEADISRNKLDYRFRQEGAANVVDVLVTSDIIEVGQVAKAVARERVIAGDESSHKVLQSPRIGTSPKKIESAWGKWLSDRRRV